MHSTSVALPMSNNMAVNTPFKNVCPLCYHILSKAAAVILLLLFISLNASLAASFTDLSAELLKFFKILALTCCINVCVGEGHRRFIMAQNVFAPAKAYAYASYSMNKSSINFIQFIVYSSLQL